MDKNIIRQVTNAVTIAIAIIVNLLANALPINNITTAQISDSFAVFLCRPATSSPSGASSTSA